MFVPTFCQHFFKRFSNIDYRDNLVNVAFEWSALPVFLLLYKPSELNDPIGTFIPLKHDFQILRCRGAQESFGGFGNRIET